MDRGHSVLAIVTRHQAKVAVYIFAVIEPISSFGEMNKAHNDSFLCPKSKQSRTTFFVYFSHNFAE
jgi:hypothetical protein